MKKSKLKSILSTTMAILLILLMLPFGQVLADNDPNDLTGNTTYLVIHGPDYADQTRASSLKITQADGTTVISPDMSSGSPVYNDIPSGAKVVMDYAFHLEDGNDQGTIYTYTGDEFFTATLPAGLNFTATTGSIIATNTTADPQYQYTMALWSITGNELTVRLTNTSEDPTGKGGAANDAHRDKWGKIHIEGTFQALQAGDGTATSITLGTQTITINRKPLPMKSTLAKSGSYDPSTNTITWTVTVTPPLGAPDLAYDGYSLIDQFSANQTYVSGTFTVKDDSVPNPVSVPDIELGIDLPNRTLTYTFPNTNPDTTGAQTITYQTKPNVFSAENGSTAENSVYSNTVNLLDGLNPAADQASSTVTLDWLSKSAASAGTADDPTIAKWTVSVTVPGQAGKAITGAAITDNLNPDLELFTDATHPVQIKFGAAAAVDVSSGGADGQYTYTSDTLTYLFPAGSQPAAGTTAIFTFYTRVKASSRDTYLNSNNAIAFHNSASLSWNENATGTYPSDTATISDGVGSGGLLSKSAAGGTGNYTYTAADPGTIHWIITVNRNNINIHNAKITDIIPEGQILLLDVSHPLTVTKKGSPDAVFQATTAAPTAELTSLDGFVNNFSYEFPEESAGTDIISSTYTVDYYTRIVDIAPVTPGDASGLDTLYRNGTVSFSNGVTLTRTGSAVATSGTKGYYSQMIAKNIATAYDYVARTIQWQIVVNRNRLPLTNAIIADTLPAGMTLLIDAGHPITVTNNTGALGNAVITAAPDTGLTSTDTFVRNFSYVLPASTSDQFTVTFWSRMDEATLKTQWSGTRNFTNSASVDADEITTPISASATAQINNPVISKSYNYSTGSDHIDWSVVINPGQVQLTNGVVTDILNAGLQLDTTSVKLYTVEVDASGNAELSGDGALVTTGYSVTLPTSGNGNTLTVNLPASTSAAYRLEFTTYIIVDDLTLTNSVSLSGSGDPTNTASASQIVINNLYSSGGSGSNTLTVHKTDTGGSPLQGAEFRLLNVNRQPITSGGNPITRTTNASGDAVFTNLPSWVFYVEETTPPAGYLIPADPISGGNRLVGTETIAVTNARALGTVSFDKTGAGGAALSGGTFTLTGGSVNMTSTANNGIVSFFNVPLGTYTITETAAPDGHALSGTTLTATVAYNAMKNGVTATVTPNPFINTPFAGNVSFNKTGAGGLPLSGGTFTLAGTDYTGTPVSLSATAVNGLVSFANVPIGAYAVTETMPPDGYLMPTDSHILDVTVAYNGTHTGLVTTIRENSAEALVVNSYANIKALGEISFTKTTINDVLLSGGTFTLTGTDYSGGNVSLSATSVDGTVTFTGVPLGNNYTIKETVPPPGYQLTTAVLTASVSYNADKTGVVTSVTPNTLTNTPAPEVFGSITVLKTDEDGKKLAGAVFELFSTDKNAVVMTAVSDQNGVALFDHVPKGQYIIRETAAPKGYILSTETIPVKIDSTAKVAFTMINKAEDKTGSIAVVKTDDAGKALPGAEFTLYDSKGVKVQSLVTGADGRVLFDNLPEGTYTVTETRAPSGYVSVSDSTKVAVKGDQTVSLAFINQKTQVNAGSITVKKLGKDSVPLAGAEFTLQDGNGTVIAKAVTGHDGTVRFVGLAPGSYKMIETEAPAGYSVYSEPLMFNIGEGQALACKLNDRLQDDESGVLGWSDIDGDDPEPPVILPQTGGIPITFYLLLGGLAMILTGIFIFWPRFRKDQ